jgi:hypothetical protein
MGTEFVGDAGSGRRGGVTDDAAAGLEETGGGVAHNTERQLALCGEALQGGAGLDHEHRTGPVQDHRFGPLPRHDRQAAAQNQEQDDREGGESRVDHAVIMARDGDDA